MKELRGHRSEGSTGHDDGAFGAERSTRTDRNCRRNRLQNRQLRLDTAAVEQNRFDRFGYSVTANALRSVSRHQADDEAAQDRYCNNEDPKMMADR